MKSNKYEIITNIFARKLPDNKLEIGDITIDVVDSILSPFNQVETVLSGLFDSANIVNKEHESDVKYFENKKKGIDTLSQNETELKKLNEDKNLINPKYTKKFTITKYGGRNKKRRNTKKR